LPDAAPLAPCGEIVSEHKDGEMHEARVSLRRACHVTFRASFHPALTATVDGAPADLVRVTPGFAAVSVPAGTHDVVVRYQPGPLKPLLLGAGLFAFAAAVVAA